MTLSRDTPRIHVLANGVRVICEADRVEVGVEAAVPLALVVVELVTNALKHAFPANGGGRIRVTLRDLGTEAVLTVEDDGIGLPDAGTRDRTSGLRLVERLVAQLQGRFEVAVDGGTRFTLTFPLGDEGDAAAGDGQHRAEAAR